MLIKDIPIRSAEDFTADVETELKKRLGGKFHKVLSPSFRYDPTTGYADTIYNSMIVGDGSFSATGTVVTRGFPDGIIDYDMIERQVGKNHRVYFFDAEECVFSQFSCFRGKDGKPVNALGQYHVQDRLDPKTLKKTPGNVQIGHKVRLVVIKIGEEK